jgi:putative hydrolase of the HAD superfamily
MTRNLTRQKIKAVIFDLDDTLYPEHEYVSCAYRDIARMVSEDYGNNPDDIYQKLMFFRYHCGDDVVFQNLMVYIGQPQHSSNEYIHSKLVPAYRNCSCNLCLFDDAKDLLDALEGKFMLGLITNGGSSTQRNKLKLLNIEDRFDSIVITGELFQREFWKPSIEPYVYCLRQLGVKPEESVYVGNNPVYDVEGASALDMRVFIRAEKQVAEEKASFTSYVLLQNLMELLNHIET